MAADLTGRSFLTLLDYSTQEIEMLLGKASELKQERRNGIVGRRFAGRTIALLFEKRSTRTRCSFETAFGEEGGHPVFLSNQDIHLGAKESLEDTARVLGRMFDAIQFRGFAQRTAEILSEYSGVPVYNGLTDSYHPTQALADLLTIRERCGDLDRASVVYVGDGRNNVAVSLIIACAKMGTAITVASPPELAPSPNLLESVSAFAKSDSIRIETDPKQAVEGADAIYTDVWTSMGEESEAANREKLLAPYQVNAELFAHTGKQECIFLHCLPAIRGKEVTDEVIDGVYSAVWEQAENRKHTIKALMALTLGVS